MSRPTYRESVNERLRIMQIYDTFLRYGSEAAFDRGLVGEGRRALQSWFPPHARARAQGCVWMSARLMGGLTPLVWTFLVVGTAYSSPVLPWRAAFVTFGLLAGRVVAVTHTESDEVIRVISVRKATRNEESSYFKEIAD